MAMLPVESGGNALLAIVYILTLENGKPRVLWSFEPATVLTAAYVRCMLTGGQLVVELFGKDPNYRNKFVPRRR